MRARDMNCGRSLVLGQAGARLADLLSGGLQYVATLFKVLDVGTQLADLRIVQTPLAAQLVEAHFLADLPGDSGRSVIDQLPDNLKEFVWIGARSSGSQSPRRRGNPDDVGYGFGDSLRGHIGKVRLSLKL